LGSDWDDLEVLAYAQHHGAPTRLLDWSKNPIVGLWFAVSEKTHDDVDGIVFRLGIGEESKLFAPTMDSGAVKFKRLDDCRCGKPIHIFPCSSRVERSERQDSFFTAAKYSSDWIFRPLPSGNEGSEIKTYIVAARIKRELRRLLVNVGLDAYTIYGDPDSFGKSVSAQWDFSGYKFGKLEKDNHLRAGQ
jgi:type I restriction enzyme M protein